MQCRKKEANIFFVFVQNAMRLDNVGLQLQIHNGITNIPFFTSRLANIATLLKWIYKKN